MATLLTTPGRVYVQGEVAPGFEHSDAYVTAKMGTALTGDPRDLALRQALSRALPARLGASVSPGAP